MEIFWRQNVQVAPLAVSQLVIDLGPSVFVDSPEILLCSPSQRVILAHLCNLFHVRIQVELSENSLVLTFICGVQIGLPSTLRSIFFEDDTEVVPLFDIGNEGLGVSHVTISKVPVFPPLQKAELLVANASPERG